MKLRVDILVVALSILTLSRADDVARKEKSFSLFSVVTFKNAECNIKSTPTIKGTCMTSTECTDKGGSADGNCAASFGVCCLLRVSKCGTAVTRNCTYLENPGYSTSTAYTAATTTTCTNTVTGSSDICHIRLDFTDVVLQQPSTAGVCTATILTITGGTSATSSFAKPPVVCGTLTGQHMYLDSARATTAATIAMTHGTGAGVNKWRIKVTQIGCSSPTRPHQGCLQWFYGSHRHTVKSFNWDGTSAHTTGGLLHNTAYSMCFRQEAGTCGTTYQMTPVASTLSAFELEEGGVSESGAACTTQWVGIQTAKVANEDRFCGRVISNVEAATIDTQTVYGTPTTGNIMNTVTLSGTSTISHAGFSLDVQLIGCIMGSKGYGSTI